MDVLSSLPFLSSSEFKVTCERLLREVRTVRDITWDSAEVREVVVSIFNLRASISN